MAFTIGWDLILEYMSGSAGGANALSHYIDSLTGNKIHDAFYNLMPLHLPGLGKYPDFLAFGVVLVAICRFLKYLKHNWSIIF